MATITKRHSKKKGTRYTAQIRITRDGRSHTESKTFSKFSLAKEWASRRESELDNPGNLDRILHEGITIRKLIEEYIKAKLSTDESAFGRSKDSHLNFLMNHEIGKADALRITPEELVNHVSARRATGITPSTANNDLVYLGTVFKYTAKILRIPVDVNVIEEAKTWCREMKLIARPAKRTRRPTYGELKMLTEHFQQKAYRSNYPMDLLIWFAIYSSRRLDEICNIRVSDLDRENGTYFLRGLKDPTGNKSKNRVAVLPKPGWEIVDLMLKHYASKDGRLFSFNSKTASSYFTKACKLLAIEDLREHDLRHEGISRLAEDGYTVPQLQQVSLHESWGSLSIYVNIPPKHGKRLDYMEFWRDFDYSGRKGVSMLLGLAA
ncbi:MAG: site-specific integrase [Candidatus Thiodiazotropha lotti]|nr:site-specific integrase [Candidatus Thiodiazotropha lotti]